MQFAKVFALLSIIGTLFLVICIQGALGFLLVGEYEYISLSTSKREGGVTCLYASGIYLLLFILSSLFINSKSNTSTNPKPKHSEVEIRNLEDIEARPLLR